MNWERIELITKIVALILYAVAFYCMWEWSGSIARVIVNIVS